MVAIPLIRTSYRKEPIALRNAARALPPEEATLGMSGERVFSNNSSDVELVTEHKEEVGCRIKLRSFFLSDYTPEITLCRMEQLTNCNRPLCNIEVTLVHKLLNASLSKEMDYWCRMLTVAFVKRMRCNEREKGGCNGGRVSAEKHFTQIKDLAHYL